MPPWLHKLAHRTAHSSTKTVLPYQTNADCSLLAHTLHELEADFEALRTRPWRSNSSYFTQVLISTLALVKMSVHAKQGGLIEVMGMLTGKIVKNTFVVMDVYLLPAEGTETRVNAQSEAYEYMVQYLDELRAVGIDDSILGWYHLHPGYGCWLSGIDVATQSLNQNFQDPYLAIVVDPMKTANHGKVEIGAFRTYPLGHVQSADLSKYRGIGSQSRLKGDLGAHSNEYYSLDIKLFKSPRDDSLTESILKMSCTGNLATLNSVASGYNTRLLNTLSQFSADIDQYTGIKNAGRQSRFNAIFESLFLRRNLGRRCGLRRPFSGLLPTAEQDQESSQGNDENDIFGREDRLSDENKRTKQEDKQDDEDEVDDEEHDNDVGMESKVHEEMDHGSVNIFEGAAGASSRSLFVCDRTVLMRKDLDPIQLDFRSTVNQWIGERESKCSTREDYSDLNETQHRMQLMALDLKRRNRALTSVAHAELFNLVAGNAKRNVFGELRL